MMRRVERSDFYRKGDLELDPTAHELDEQIRALPGWKVTSGIQRARVVESPDAVDRAAVLRLVADARLQGDPGLLRTCHCAGACLCDDCKRTCAPTSAHEHVLELGEAIPGGSGYWLCGSCGKPMTPPSDAKARNDAALAATPAEPAAVDVELLARAIFEAERPGRHWPTWDEYLATFANGATQADVWYRKAERVAAEYARLSKPAQRETER